MLAHNRFKALDGWRGISILLVLAGHLLPLGPKSWQMNEAIAATGMALFFILSGFLITNLLIKDDNVLHFLIRRALRIFPLAWLVLVITFVLSPVSSYEWLSHFFFYANSTPIISTTQKTSHFWSLCVEVQFYVFVAFIVFLFRQRGLYLLPILCLAITALRFYFSVDIISIRTHFRVDEILSGCILALIYHKANATYLQNICNKINPILLFILLILSANSHFPTLNYFRPYIALLLVAVTLFSDDIRWYNSILESRFLIFVAGISYALYVIHGGLRYTWLGDGDILEKYAKRPLFFAVIFGLAYLSTRYYENYWIQLGKRLTTKK